MTNLVPFFQRAEPFKTTFEHIQANVGPIAALKKIGLTFILSASSVALSRVIETNFQKTCLYSYRAPFSRTTVPAGSSVQVTRLQLNRQDRASRF